MPPFFFFFLAFVGVFFPGVEEMAISEVTIELIPRGFDSLKACP